MRTAALGIALALFTLPLSAQTVMNSSFEANAPTGNYNFAAPTGWTCPNIGGGRGMQNPTAAQVGSGIDGNTVIWVNAGAGCSQDVGPAVAATNYSLVVSVGSQNGFTGGYTIAYGGCSVSGTTKQGSLLPVTLPCPTPTGELVISLSTTSGQVLFDNVVLTSTSAVPPPPPVFQTTSFGAQLVNCVICDGTDYTALPSASLYQGATYTLQQQAPVGANQNICKATLNANAQGSCSGPVNIHPAMVIFIISITNPAGAQMFPPFAFAAPGLIVGGAPTGNIKVIIGFDATTSIPRAGQVYSQ